MALNHKQKRFCQEYVVDGDASKAARRAGYSKKTAGSIGDENLKKPEIKAEIDKLQAELRIKSGISAEMVINELVKMAFWNIQDFIEQGNEIKDLKSLDRETAIPIAGIKVKVAYLETGKEVTTELKMPDKVAALVHLGKHLGIFEIDNRQKGRKIIVRRKND